MKRKDFIQIIKLRSVWRTGRGKGNYTLPSGEKLQTYIQQLVESQLEIDNLGILENGELAFCDGGDWNPKKKEFDDFQLMPAFKDNEICSYEEQERRIKSLVRQIINAEI